MIKVNLLPEIYRQKERTPLPMLAGIIGGVTFTALVLVGFLYLHIQKLSEVNTRLASKEETRKALQKEALKFDQLTTQKADLEKLGNAVKQLDASRIRWARPVDDLAWIIHDSDKGQDVKAWIANLLVEGPKKTAVPRPGQAPEGGKMEFDVEIAGQEMDRMSIFREAFKKKDRWLGQHLQGLNPPNILRKDYSREYDPPFAVASKTQVSLKPREIPKPAAPAAGGAAPGGPPAGGQAKAPEGTKK
jgi:hypothetical protein